MAPIYTTGVTGVQTASVCSFAPGAGLVTFRQTFVYLAKGCGCACASLPREAAANVMGTNRELVVAASLAARAAASNRSMKISAIIAVPSMVRSTRLHGRAELSVQSFPVSTTVPLCSWSICPLRETCYFAPNICSSPPSWLDRQRAAPFLKERDTTARRKSPLHSFE